MSSVPPYQRPEQTYGAAPPDAGYRDPAVAPPGWRGDAGPAGPAPATPPPPGAWAQPPPGYADPNYPDPAYQPQAGYGPGYRQPRVRRTGPGLATVAPALFASLIISIGVVVLFIGNLFVALGAPHGTAGRDRFLQFLAPADVAVAAAMVLAVALVVLQRQMPADSPVVGARGGRVRSIALVAGGVAAFVALAAVVRGFMILTVPHQPGAVKFGELVAALAVAAIAASAAWWALRHRW
jgi:hypothetical protein